MEIDSPASEIDGPKSESAREHVKNVRSHSGNVYDKSSIKPKSVNHQKARFQLNWKPRFRQDRVTRRHGNHMLCARNEDVQDRKLRAARRGASDEQCSVAHVFLKTFVGWTRDDALPEEHLEWAISSDFVVWNLGNSTPWSLFQ